jgi:hypothetical protein
VTTPPLQVPPVTTGQLQIGSHTLGPYAVGGQTIPSMSIGGGTFGQVNSGAEVVGVGAVSCAAASVTNPGQTMLVSGSMHLDLSIEETDPSCATGFVVWSSQRKQLTPTPASAGPLASGVIIDAESGVPAAGQRDPHTGNTSDGLAEHYLGTSLFVNGTTQPTGIGCEDGDLDCAI